MGKPIPVSLFQSGRLAASMERLLATARARQSVKRTALFWLDDATGRLTCVATAGVGEPGEWLGQTLAVGVGMAGRAVKEGRPVWTPDLLADPRVPVAPWLRERLVQEGLRSVAAAPVRMDGVVRGALGFLDGPGRTFDEGSLQRIEALADEVAGHVERALRAGS